MAPHSNDNDLQRRNQCVECSNRHDNRNMVCDTCMADPRKSYGRFSDDVDPASREAHS